MLIENCNIFCFLGLHEEFKATEEAVDTPQEHSAIQNFFLIFGPFLHAWNRIQDPEKLFLARATVSGARSGSTCRGPGTCKVPVPYQANVCKVR